MSPGGTPTPKIMRLTISLIILCLSSLFASAQTNDILSGTVVDEKGEPLIGATVMVKGTSIGTSTDIDGKYSIKAPGNKKVTLLISYV